MLEQYKNKKDPLEEETDKLVEVLEEKLDSLKKNRPALEDVKEAHEKLSKHVDTLTKEGVDLPATESDLDKVREAIHALSRCPGLTKPTFIVPKWAGEWVEVEVQNVPEDENSGPANDRLLDEACQKRFGSLVRAAETSEIGAKMVEGLPLSNNANLPIFGKGPNAKGKPDDTGKHFRVCWPVNGALTAEAKQEDCGEGKKAVACIWDRRLSASELESKLEEAREGADEMLNGVAVFKISVGTGRCTTPKITDACKAAKMTPICNSPIYAKSGGTTHCWQDKDFALGKYGSIRFSFPSENKQVGLDPKKLAGMCFSTGKAAQDWALYNTGTTHAWTNNVNTVVQGDGKTWKASQQDEDGWYTWCISNEERELAAEMWEQQKVKIYSANMPNLVFTLAATDQGDVPLFKIPVGKGRCNSNKIADACKNKQMTPVCATTAWQNSKVCWGATGKMYLNKRFTLPALNPQMGLDKFKLAGVCFYFSPNQNAIYGRGGYNTEAWTQTSSSIMLEDKKVVTAKEMDEDGWFTYCTLEKATR